MSSSSPWARRQQKRRLRQQQPSRQRLLPTVLLLAMWMLGGDAHMAAEQDQALWDKIGGDLDAEAKSRMAAAIGDHVARRIKRKTASGPYSG